MNDKTWFHYGDIDQRTRVLRPLRVCNGHTRGVEGKTPCSDIKRLLRGVKRRGSR